MIFILPCWLFVIQELQESLAPNRISCSFDKESATPSRAHKGINFADQVLWKKHVCAYGMHIDSVTNKGGSVEFRILNSLPRGLIQHDAGCHSRIQRLHPRRVRDVYDLIHLSQQSFLNARSFISYKDRRFPAQVCLMQRGAFVR